MSNLPVLWVPPVTPPSPEDRPPRNRRTRNLVLAAVALILAPFIAFTVFGQTGHGLRVAEGPSTSGGNLPYIAAPATAPGTGGESATKPATPAAETKTSTAAQAPETPAASVGADGQPVRVIDMEKKGAATPTVVARPQPAKSDPAPTKPAETAATASQATTGQATTAPSAAVPAMRPSVDPLPTPRPAEPTTSEASAPADQSTAAPARKPVEKRTVAREAPAPRVTTPPTDGRNDFPDRLATIRRSESRRAIEAPPPAAMEDDDEVIVVPRRRGGWGFLPPLFGSDEPSRPALRSFDPPERTVRNREQRAENCHYHAYPTEDMTFHRDVRCHWHQDPHDPSIRYVTPVQP